MDQRITYIGLDVHKETIAVALAEGSGRGEVCAHGQISNTPAALTRLSSKLSRNGSVLAHSDASGRLFRQHPVRHSGTSGQLRIVAA